jgi:hypothetical protein
MPAEANAAQLAAAGVILDGRALEPSSSATCVQQVLALKRPMAPGRALFT